MEDVARNSALFRGERGRAQGFIRQHGGAIVRLGFVIDSGVILLALCGALSLLGIEPRVQHLFMGIFATLLFQIGAAFSHVYRSWRMVRLRAELTAICALWTTAFCLMVVAALLLRVPDMVRVPELAGQHTGEILIAWYVLALAAIATVRIGIRMSLRYYRAFGHDHRSVAFIGSTRSARDLAATFKRHSWMGIDVAGFYAGDENSLPNSESSSPVTRPINELLEAARRREVDAIYIALPTADEDEIKALIDRFGDTTVSIYYCPPLHMADVINGRWDDVGGRPVISIVESPFSGPDRQLKRLEDLVLVALIMPVAIVAMAVIAVAIKLSSPGPVIYRQTRYGLDGREFQMWKFRTMTVTETDEDFRQTRRDDPRVTRVGALLRKTSLDELPQLYNVIVNDMSVVGPRPHPKQLNEDHRRIIPRYMQRHIVKPGITGWAQVNGYRGETDTVDKMRVRLEYDLQYIQNWSIWADIRILFKTIHHVIAGSNAY